MVTESNCTHLIPVVPLLQLVVATSVAQNLLVDTLANLLQTRLDVPGAGPQPTG